MTRYLVTYAATGRRHLSTVLARDTTGRALCGTDKAMPTAEGMTAPGADRADALGVLGALESVGALVCGKCAKALRA